MRFGDRDSFVGRQIPNLQRMIEPAACQSLAVRGIVQVVDFTAPGRNCREQRPVGRIPELYLDARAGRGEDEAVGS